MQNNINIFNYWYTDGNYGAVLTAYALQCLVETFGRASLLVDNFKKNPTHKTTSVTTTFTKNNLQITEKILSVSALLALANNSSNFIVGSDQVFRPIYTNKMIEQFLLDFVIPQSKKIAFSASFGVDKDSFLEENAPEVIEHMKNSLRSFDFISVREKSGVEICRDLFDVKAEWIIDPVFILDRAKWDELIENSTPHPSPLPQGARENSPQIVSYVLDTNKEYKKASKYLSKQHNAEVIELANSNESVENWLKAIRDCKFLITDSFHGMCFAIIFNKPFICLANKKRGATRFESILEMLNIDYQCINNIKEIYERNCIFEVDYDVVNKRIEEERQRGLDFLKTALEAPVQVTPEKIEARMKFLENKVCELEQQATLKYQVKKELWNLWRIIFHKYLPEPVKNGIRILRKLVQRG